MIFAFYQPALESIAALLPQSDYTFYYEQFRDLQCSHGGIHF